MSATTDGEDRVLATAQKILKSLRTSKDETKDMVFILSSFDNRLSHITDFIDNPDPSASSAATAGSASSETPSGDVARFEIAEDLILRRDSDLSSLWEDSHDESSKYLAAVDKVLQLMEDLSFQQRGDVMDRADTAVQVAMARLEEEFQHVLVRNTVPLDLDRLCESIRRVPLSFSVGVGEGDIIDELGNFGDDHGGEGSGKHCYHERGGSLGGDACVDLINHDVIADLREIAERMIRAGYEKECCQVYSGVRRDVLDDCLGILGVEKLSIEEIQKIDGKSLDDKMKKWVQAVKLMVKDIMLGEKRLCDQIFDEFESVNAACFVQTTKGCVMQLLHFGEAVAIRKRSPEKLFRILDMYDALAYSMRYLQDLFANNEPGERVYREAKGVLNELGEAAMATFKEFEKAVKGEASKRPIHGGEIHPLARYVMNYLKLLVEYSNTLNTLLDSDEKDADYPHNDGGDDLKDLSPLAHRVTLLINSLISNLEDKAAVYEDPALQYIFLMNNKLYIVQKVKDSDLAKLLGDDWVRRCRGLIRKYATSYLRISWSKALSCLRDEGIIGGGSSGSAFKMALKEKFKNFNACFEDIYRIQTAWKVPDPQLREELRISISEKVIPAYRAFLGRFGSQLEGGKHAGKYIKYTAEDLEAYLADLFEGTPSILHLRRKSA